MTEIEFLSKPRTIKEFADYISTTDRFVRDQILKGALRARKHSGKCIRLWPADMRAWIDRGDTIAK
jgi:hypothetical protein